MTTYTKRDLRAADMLALILVGFGVLLLIFGVMPVLLAAAGKAGGSVRPALCVLGGVFVLLGTALNLKVRQLVRNRGRETDEYPGVPD
ncbi:MAG: hypothetical protein KDE27_18145 [Planctomycetes bacterium]|nr:hypothetical protein [Planctomycetota bacterium]